MFKSLSGLSCAGRRCAGALGILVVAALLSGGAEPQTASVAIDNFTFTPEVLTVAPGTIVEWRNGDDIPHTVMATDKSFRSKPLDTNDRFAFTFTKPGDYAYFCSLHPHMTGKIVVKAP